MYVVRLANVAVRHPDAFPAWNALKLMKKIARAARTTWLLTRMETAFSWHPEESPFMETDEEEGKGRAQNKANRRNKC